MSNSRKKAIRRTVGAAVLLIVIPLVIYAGIQVYSDRRYMPVSMTVALLSCIPFFLRFEKGKYGTREMTVIAVMTAISVIGRLVFYALPGFKPVTAIVIITGIAFGAEAGFLTGSLSALVSNVFFGQGPWTPFQMLLWGLIGFFAGLASYNKKRPNRIVLTVLGVLGGIIFSLIMDIWTTLSATGTFTVQAYLLNVFSSLPFMAVYAVSNVIFLLLLAPSLLDKTDRIRAKYRIFQD